MSFLINPYRFAASGIASPEDVSGLTVWMDATDTSTMWTDAGITAVSADGDAVYRWQNKAAGGSSNNFDQASAGARPTYKTGIQNGLAALRYDGNDVLTSADVLPANSFTLFAVCAQDAGQADNIAQIFTCNGIQAQRFALFDDTRASPQRNCMGSSNVFVDLLAESAPGWRQLAMAYDHTDGTWGKIYGYFEGTLQGSASLTAAVTRNNSEIGYNVTLSLVGYLSELLIYNSVLSTTDRESVQDYLTSRWGL